MPTRNRFPIKILVLPLLFAVACSSKPTKTIQHDRWDVKTLTDLKANGLLPVETMSISRLVKFKEHKIGKSTERINAEQKVVRLTVNIVDYREEADGDIHLVIDDGSGDSLVAEVPDPEDAIASMSDHANDYRKVRLWLRTQLGEPGKWNGKSYDENKTLLRIGGLRVTITGVIFFDLEHKVDGKADNNLELHPVIGIE
jgi:hypothetical protein